MALFLKHLNCFKIIIPTCNQTMHVRKDFVKERFKSLHSMWFYQQIHVKFISSYQTVTNTTCISSFRLLIHHLIIEIRGSYHFTILNWDVYILNLYFLDLYIYVYIYIAELDCCQIIILRIYVPSTHAYTHVLRLSLDLPYETR